MCKECLVAFKKPVLMAGQKPLLTLETIGIRDRLESLCMLFTLKKSLDELFSFSAKAAWRVSTVDMLKPLRILLSVCLARLLVMVLS